MKRTIEIDDTLKERESTQREEVAERFKEICEKFKGASADKLRDEMMDVMHEVTDSNTPIYNYEINDLFYLHSNELEEAYENAGIGDKTETNWKQAAIFCHLESVGNDHLEELLKELE